MIEFDKGWIKSEQSKMRFIATITKQGKNLIEFADDSIMQIGAKAKIFCRNKGYDKVSVYDRKLDRTIEYDIFIDDDGFSQMKVINKGNTVMFMPVD